MNKHAHKAIKEFTQSIVSQVGIKLDAIKIIDGEQFGCTDTHMINISAKGKIFNVLAYHSDLDDLFAGRSCDKLEMKVRSSLLLLRKLLNDP
jgi:hypothetical protein